MYSAAHNIYVNNIILGYWMYSLTDLFSIMSYHLHIILRNYFFVLAHFFILVLCWKYLRGRYLLQCRQFRGVNLSTILECYQQRLLISMILVSLGLSLILYFPLRVILFLGSDFVYVAGVALGWRRGWMVMLVGMLSLLARVLLQGVEWLWVLYVVLDVLIYYLMGSIIRIVLHMDADVLSWSDILFVCMNKILVSLFSAACWLLLMQDTWSNGFSLLLFRLVAWPLISLPLISLLLMLLREDYRESRLAAMLDDKCVASSVSAR